MNRRSRMLVVAALVWLVVSFFLYWSGLGLERYESWATVWTRAVPLHAVVPLYDSACLDRPAVVGGELNFGCRTEFSALGFAVLALLPLFLVGCCIAAADWVRKGGRAS